MLHTCRSKKHKMYIQLKKRGVLPVQNMKKSTLLYRNQCEYGYVYILKDFREKKNVKLWVYSGSKRSIVKFCSCHLRYCRMSAKEPRCAKSSIVSMHALWIHKYVAKKKKNKKKKKKKKKIVAEALQKRASKYHPYYGQKRKKRVQMVLESECFQAAQMVREQCETCHG